MKFLILACVWVASVSAITDIRDCGTPNAIVRVPSGSLSPDPVPVPGEINVVLTLESSEELPIDLIIRKDVRKVFPDEQVVPCLDGIHGSCVIQVCELIATQPDLICPNFPPEVPCACPLPAGTFVADAIVVHIGEQWLDLGFDVDGDYRVRFDLASDASPGHALGCLEADFSLAKPV